MTRAWILAVKHFMEQGNDTQSAETFMVQNPALLDTTSMLTHYTEDILFSDEARLTFMPPNLEAIPQYT